MADSTHPSTSIVSDPSNDERLLRLVSEMYAQYAPDHSARSLAVEGSIVQLQEADGGQKWVVRQTPSRKMAHAALYDVIDQNARLVITIGDPDALPGYLPSADGTPLLIYDTNQAPTYSLVVLPTSTRLHQFCVLRVLSIQTMRTQEIQLVMHLQMQWPDFSETGDPEPLCTYLTQMVDSCNRDDRTCHDQYRGISPTIIVESSLPTAFKMQEFITFASVARMYKQSLASLSPDPGQATSEQLNLYDQAVMTACVVSRQWKEAWPRSVEEFMTLCNVVAAMRSQNAAQRPPQAIPSNQGYQGI